MKALAIVALSVIVGAVSAPLAHADVPLAPRTVRKARIDDAQVRITWADVSDNEEGFEILRRTIIEPDFESRGTVGAGVTEFIDDAPRGTVFIYRVRAFNSDGDSDLSNECYVNRARPAVPLYFNVHLIALTVVRVGWDDRSSGERGFEIQRADFGKGFKTIKTVPANTEFYDDYTLHPANTYTYRVRALGRPGICWDDSKFTPERTVTTKGGVRILQVELSGHGKGTVTSIPSRISCGPHDDHCAAEFPLATDVTLVAKHNDKSRFAGWVNVPPRCQNTTDPCTINLSEDRVIGAVFRLK